MRRIDQCFGKSKTIDAAGLQRLACLFCLCAISIEHMNYIAARAAKPRGSFCLVGAKLDNQSSLDIGDGKRLSSLEKIQAAKE